MKTQIKKIRNSISERQSGIACHTANEVSRRKNTAKAKLKATRQEQRIHTWKQHFKNLHGKPPESYALTNHKNYYKSTSHQTNTIYARRIRFNNKKNFK